MHSADGLWLLATVFLALVAPAAVRAEYPPGPLSRAHADLEGLTTCTRCHVLRERSSAKRCLACHPEIAVRVAAGRGPHGRLPPTERGCGSCHPEHKGRDVPLIDWGPAGRDGFDHGRAGWPLRDRHASTRCSECHRRDRVEDDVVRDVLARQPQRKTYLGVPLACAGCHRDVHRGQLSRACETCHGERVWTPADRFSHAKTSYPLEGKHARVQCRACHPLELPLVGPCRPPLACDGEAPIWQHGSEAVVRYRPVQHAACEDCHRNTHAAKFSERCVACHVTASWLEVDERRFVARHAETRYPLNGAHARATCRSCHGPWGGAAPRFVGIPFRACSDCHKDAHVGQLADLAGPRTGCDRCHPLDAFKPVRFTADDHAATRFRLAGAHRAIACARCHPKDPLMPERFPAEARDELERQGRPVRVSLARLELRGTNFERCDGCHKDPHRGQMAERVQRDGCKGCHEPTSFKIPRFDHKATAFPLVGKHLETACAACHPRDRTDGEEGPITRYRGVPKECAGCHDDVHAGQLALDAFERSACQRCHDPVSWKKTRFVHAPPFTDYRLEGRHAAVKCDGCHFKVSVDGRQIVRYRPLPADCERCHADDHRGRFNGYAP